MRVALVSHNAKAGDAIGNQVAEKLVFFLDRGAEVRVLVESAERIHPGVAQHQQLMKPEAEGAAWDFLSTADIACFEFGQFYSLLGLLPLLSEGKPRIIVDYHGITPLELWSGHNREAVVKGLQHRGLVRHADRVLVHSRYIERELLGITGIQRERICPIGLPVDLARFHRPNDDAMRHDRIRRDLGLMDANLLLYVGRLAPNKRVPVLIEALAKLRGSHPPAHLLIVGDTSDLYHAEAEACWRRATELGVSERVHFLGHLADDELPDVYRTADLFVTASRWEGFCVPVVEAMASGLPVIAARAAALPETVGDAGLTFNPDDADDLAATVSTLLIDRAARAAAGDKIAIVACRYGPDIVGGAEWSLRRIAHALRQAGHDVEVFTTCNRDESRWSNELPEGTATDAGMPVHRFRIDDHDRARHLATVEAIQRSDGRVAHDIEQDYLAHSLHATALIDGLQRRQDEFSAIIVGPYLFGLTADVARAFPDQTLLLPCFHAEPLVRLELWKEIYAGVAGILYHSVEEQDLAQMELGINHPGSAVIGTWLDVPPLQENAEKAQPGIPGRCLVYCGRYSPQKELPRLLEFARRYHGEHPGRFTFAFMGRGDVPIPHEPWAIDLGFVDEQRKAEVLRSADALAMLSRNESLSLVALEAWAQETPVIASASCAVLAGHMQRSGAGAAISDYATFARALDELWDNPGAWRERGRQGRHYVIDHYGSSSEFLARLEDALAEMKQPLAERMRQRGRSRAERFARPRWQECFAVAVEDALHAEPLAREMRLEIRPARTEYHAQPGGELLCSVRLVNRGSQPAWAEGPGRSVLRGQVMHDGHAIGASAESSLPGLVLPGQHELAVISVTVPVTPDNYQLAFWTAPVGSDPALPTSTEKTHVQLRVADAANVRDNSFCAPLLQSVQTLLARAERLHHLPDDYFDVSEGRFASWKRWLKRKFLNNFKTAYVDVLSRQQSQVNRELLSAVQELAECCATLDHAVRMLSERVLAAERSQSNSQTAAADQTAPMTLSQPTIPVK